MQYQFAQQPQGYSAAQTTMPMDSMGICGVAIEELEKEAAALEERACSLLRPSSPENANPETGSDMRQRGSPVSEQALQFANRVKAVRARIQDISNRIDL